MTSGVEDWGITAILCDAAQVAEGKLYILGGGWSLSGPGAFTHAIALKVEVPWGAANERHRLDAVLVDEDGNAVAVGDPAQEVAFSSEFEVGRPAGLPAGTPLDFPIAVNFGPLEVPAGRGYAWSLRIDGAETERVPFRTRPA
jgi:hypothetical protein